MACALVSLDCRMYLHLGVTPAIHCFHLCQAVDGPNYLYTDTGLIAASTRGTFRSQGRGPGPLSDLPLDASPDEGLTIVEAEHPRTRQFHHPTPCGQSQRTTTIAEHPGNPGPPSQTTIRVRGVAQKFSGMAPPVVQEVMQREHHTSYKLATEAVLPVLPA